MAQIVGRYSLSDLGIDNPQYFPGFGVSFTDFEFCAVGIGNDPREALDDCLEQLAQMGFNAEQLESRILKRFPDFNNAELCEGTSVSANAEPSEESDDCEGSDCGEQYYHVGLRWDTDTIQ